MGEVLEIEWGNLDALFEDCRAIRAQVAPLKTYFKEHVCSTAGFDFPWCALTPLSTAIGGLDSFFEQTATIFETRLDGLMGAVESTARRFDLQDGQLDYDFGQLNNGSRSSLPSSVAFSNSGLVTVEQPGVALVPPGAGFGQDHLLHDPIFSSVASAINGVRDDINRCITWCHEHGITVIPHLPDKDLQHYIVYPLSGDYRAIQANAESSKRFAEGLRIFARNFQELAKSSVLAMKGQTGGSLLAHIMAYRVVMEAVAFVAEGLAKLFDSLARVSENFAVKVERMIRILGQRLLKLAKFFVKKVHIAVAIWDTFREVWDKGVDFFREVWDDVMKVKALIERAFGMVEKVKAFAEEWAAKFAQARAMVDEALKLPEAVKNGDLSSLGRLDIDKFEREALGRRKDFDLTAGAATVELDSDTEAGANEAAGNEGLVSATEELLRKEENKKRYSLPMPQGPHFHGGR